MAARTAAEVVLALRTDTAQYTQGLAKAAADYERTLAKFRRGSGAFEEKLPAAFRNSATEARNLGFQLNDVITQLSSGASLTQTLAQQSGQIAQSASAMGTFGGLARGAVGAVTGLLNPLGLVAIATVGVTAAAASYFSEWISGGQSTSEEIEKQAALIQRVAERYGDSVPALKAYADELKRAADEQERIAALQVTRGNVADVFRSQFEDASAALAQLGPVAGEARQQIIALEGAVSNETATMADFDRIIATLNERFAVTGDEGVAKVISAFATLRGIPFGWAKLRFARVAAPPSGGSTIDALRRRWGRIAAR